MIVETFHYHLENEIESGSENIINHFTWLSCTMTFLDTHYVVLNNFDTTIRPLVRHWKVLAGENHLKSHLPPYHTHTHTHPPNTAFVYISLRRSCTSDQDELSYFLSLPPPRIYITLDHFRLDSELPRYY